jgi:hypothetical protein
MKVKELDAKSDEELRQLADESFASMEDPHTAESLQHLQKAQFYLSLLNRRHDDRVAARDLRLEIIVIALIALEIVFGVVEGSKQADILSNMQASTAATAKALQDQGVILGKMNDNTSATVTAFGKLQTAQDGSLTAQKQSLATSKNTLGSIGRMNAALEQELNLNFAVAITVLADNEQKRITVSNLTKTAIYLWGAKFSGEPAQKFTDERFVSPGAGYAFFADSLFKSAVDSVPKGQQRDVPLDLYLESADGKQYIAHGFLTEKWEGDVMKFYTTTTSVKPEKWPGDVLKETK